jgi:hypothetical protein
MELKIKTEFLSMDATDKHIYAHLTNSPTNPLDCLDVEIRQCTKHKKAFDYNVFLLYVKINNKRYVLKLMENQLNNLIEQYGTKSEDWVNLPVDISGEETKDGYINAVVKPTKEFIEEVLK